jgi:DNA-binding phage protein
MMGTKTAPYDVAELLETPEEMDAYLEASIHEQTGMLPSLQRHWAILPVPSG